MLASGSQVAYIAERFAEALYQQGVRVSRIYLFGSHLRGTATALSDVDMVAISPDFAPMEPWDRARITGKASSDTFKATGEVVEALAKTPEEVASAHPASFLADVLRDAEVVYEGGDKRGEAEPRKGAPRR